MHHSVGLQLSADAEHLQFVTYLRTLYSIYWNAAFIYLLAHSQRGRIFNVTHQGAARDAASVHFRATIMRADILVIVVLLLPRT